MVRGNEPHLKVLQRKCVRALRLYTDLAETSCEILCRFEGGQIPPRERVKLMRLSRQEALALDAYLQARRSLLSALSDTVSPDDKGICRVVSAMT
jgi:hypothetical protein